MRGTHSKCLEALRRADPDGLASYGPRHWGDAWATPGPALALDEEPGCRDASDADDDGSLDISDAAMIPRVLFLGQGMLPEPSRTCGDDPTMESLGCEAPVCGSDE